MLTARHAACPIQTKYMPWLAVARACVPASPATVISNTADHPALGSPPTAAGPADSRCPLPGRRLRIKQRSAKSNAVSGQITGQGDVSGQSACHGISSAVATTTAAQAASLARQPATTAALASTSTETAGAGAPIAAAAPGARHAGVIECSDTETDVDTDSEDEKDLRALAVHISAKPIAASASCSPAAVPKPPKQHAAKPRRAISVTAPQPSGDRLPATARGSGVAKAGVNQDVAGTDGLEGQAGPARTLAMFEKAQDAQQPSKQPPMQLSSDDSDATVARPGTPPACVSPPKPSVYPQQEHRAVSSAAEPRAAAQGVAVPDNKPSGKASAPGSKGKVPTAPWAQPKSQQAPCGLSRSLQPAVDVSDAKPAKRSDSQKDSVTAAVAVKERQQSGLVKAAPDPHQKPNGSSVPYVNPCKRRPVNPAKTAAVTGAVRKTGSEPDAQSAKSTPGSARQQGNVLAEAAVPVHQASQKGGDIGHGQPQEPSCRGHTGPPPARLTAASASAVRLQSSGVANAKAPVNPARSCIASAKAATAAPLHVASTTAQPAKTPHMACGALGGMTAARRVAVAPQGLRRDDCAIDGGPAAVPGSAPQCLAAVAPAIAAVPRAVPVPPPCGPPPHPPPVPAAGGSCWRPSCAPNCRFPPRVMFQHKPIPPRSAPPPLPPPCPPPHPPRHAPPFCRPVPPACPPPPLREPPAASSAVASLADLSTLRDLLTFANQPTPPATSQALLAAQPQPALPAKAAAACDTASAAVPPASAIDSVSARTSKVSSEDSHKARHIPPTEPHASRPNSECDHEITLRRGRSEQPARAAAARSRSADKAHSERGSTLRGATVAAPSKPEPRENKAGSSQTATVRAPSKPPPQPANDVAICRIAPKICFSLRHEEVRRCAKATSRPEFEAAPRWHAEHRTEMAGQARRAEGGCAPPAGTCSQRASPVRSYRDLLNPRGWPQYDDDARPEGSMAAGVLASDRSKRPRVEATRTERGAKAARRSGGHADRPPRRDERRDQRRDERHAADVRSARSSRSGEVRAARPPRQPLQHMQREVLNRAPHPCDISAASLPSDGDLFGC
eukprot:jgi/Ulvmu1/794/UM010_0168.1